jgi:hypothetical protein
MGKRLEERHRRKWENNIKTDATDIVLSDIDYFNPVQKRNLILEIK